MSGNTALTRAAVLSALGLAVTPRQRPRPVLIRAMTRGRGAAGTPTHGRALQSQPCRISIAATWCGTCRATGSLINRGPNRFFYSGGIWYAPRGGGFDVVAPPIGVFIPVLPPFYSTVWFGGVPYYYANDTYYMWSAPDNGYEVVEPRPGR